MSMTDGSMLTGTRELLAEICRMHVDADVTVVDSLPDSIAPPAVLIGWGDPWLSPSTLCPGGFVANAEILVVAQRIEPGGQYATIEKWVGTLATVFRKDTQIVIRDISSPFPMQLGGVDYLTASINVIQEMGD